MVVFVDEVDEYSTTLFRIGDNRGHRRQIGDDPVLEVEDKHGSAVRLASQSRVRGPGIPLR